MLKDYLGIRLRNQRKGDKRQSCQQNTQSMDVDRNDESIDPREIIECLKAIKVTNQNMEEIKQKLAATVTTRMDMMKSMKLDLLETFPYFFTHPSLVNSNIFREFILD